MAEARELLGGVCAECGATEKLEIDHIDWTQKTLAINKMWAVAKHRFLAELDKCQLLCKDCHIEKSKHDLHEMRKIVPGQNQYTKGRKL